MSAEHTQNVQMGPYAQLTAEELHGIAENNDLNVVDDYPIDPAFNMNNPFGSMANNNQFYPNGPALPIPQQPTGMPSMYPAPTPPLGTPAMMADTSQGAYRHPVIGWYFPAVPVAASPFGGPPPPPVTEGYVPAFPQLPQQTQFNAPTPRTAPAPQTASTLALPSGKGKRKMKGGGPAAFEVEQARRNKNGAPRQDSVEVVYSSNQKHRDDRAKPAAAPKFTRAREAPTLVQTCICNDKNQGKIKRPKNAFILYRMAKSQEYKKIYGNANQDISKAAGVSWSQESEAVKAHFRVLAEKEQERHKTNHPGYKYTPGRAREAKFGSASCTCGAYQANLTALQQANSRKQTTAADDEEPDLEEYVPPGTPPAAPMFGLDTSPYQPQQRTAAQLEALKRKRATASIREVDDEEDPISKRRSRRTGRNTISYAEPDEDDIFEQDPTETFKRRPTQIGDGPANRTRSRSQSRGSSLSKMLAVNNTSYDAAFNFGHDANPDFDNVDMDIDAEYTGDFSEFWDSNAAEAEEEETRGRPTRRNSSRSSARGATVAPSQLLRRSSRNNGS